MLLGLKTEIEPTSKMSCFFKILDDGQSPRKNCQLTSVMLCSVFWISCPLKTGPTGCPKISVSNYHSMLCDIAQERRSHMTLWQRLVWNVMDRFRVIQFGALYVNLRQPHIFKCQIKKKTLSCIQVTMLINKKTALHKCKARTCTCERTHARTHTHTHTRKSCDQKRQCKGIKKDFLILKGDNGS